MTDDTRQQRTGHQRTGHQRTRDPKRRARDIGSIAIGLGVVALLAIGGSGRAPGTQAAAPPADRVSHGAAGTARNGVGGSIAASPTMASWPGTGDGRNGGPFAFIGAQYGSLWSMPPTANNSLGVGYCVMEDISGEGVVSLQPDPAVWDAGEMARAGALMSSFGGDRVVPYGIDASGAYDVASGEWQQPSLFGAGEYTRRRHVAVNFGVKMFVEDVSPRGVAAGRKLARDTAVVDGTGDNFPALRDGYTMAQRLVKIAEIQHAVGGVGLELQWGTADGAAPVGAGTYPLEVHASDATGKPVGFVPVVQLSELGAAGERSEGAVSAVDMSAATPDDIARLHAAVATGWPTMDMASRLADDATSLLATSPTSAGVTDEAGIVRFDVTIDRQAWEVAFLAQAPTADVSLYAGSGIQGQITWSGPPQSATVHDVAAPPVTGDVAIRKVVDPADIGAGRDLSGFEFTISPVGSPSVEIPDEGPLLRSDASGRTPTVELPVGRYRVSEVATPDWAAGLLDGGPVEFVVEPDDSGATLDVAYTNVEPTASITTAVRDRADGDQMIDLTQGDATIIDSLTYRNLVPGTEYVAVGELMLLPGRHDGDGDGDGDGDDDDDDDGDSSWAADPLPTGVVGSTPFVAAASTGTVDVSFEVPADSPLVGHTAVAYQRIEVRTSGRAVATHHDPAATEQTIWFPSMSTTLVAVDRDTTAAAVEPGDALIDFVEAHGLRPDRRYRADLTLHRRLDDGTCVATDHTASAEFAVIADVGPTTFAVDGVHAPEPGVFVAFQTLTALDDHGGDRVVARHADCNSVSQRVVVVAAPVTTTTTTTTTTAPSTTTAPTTTTPATTTAPSTTTAATSPTTTTRPSSSTAVVPPTRPASPLPRTGTDATSTLAVGALALLLVGVAISTTVRRPVRPHERTAKR